MNAVSPGVIATPPPDRTTPPEMLAAAVAQIPMRRVGTAEECVGAFLILGAAAMSSDVTGRVIEVNGGLPMP